jgi:hypothetical protein
MILILCHGVDIASFQLYNVESIMHASSSDEALVKRIPFQLPNTSP